MIVLGLDLSSKPGYAVLKDGVTLSLYGTVFGIKKDIKPKVNNDLVPDYELILIAKQVANVAVNLAKDYNPDIIAIEQTNQGRSRQTQKGLEFIHYAVLSALDEAGFANKITYIDTSQWRKICNQKLNTEQRKHNKRVNQHLARGKIKGKHLAVQWVNERFGLSLIMKNEDAADAISIAYAAQQIANAKINGNIDIDALFSEE